MSRKEPDLSISVEQNGIDKVKWVLEVGFSESREQLENDARLWLEGMPDNIVMVMLVMFQEDPQYRCPLSRDEDPSTRGIPLDLAAIHRGQEDFIVVSPLGPATYKGLTWVGYIKGISMEVWVQGTDGKATQQGPAKDLLHERTMEIRLGDFLPPPYHGTLVVNLERFRKALPSCIHGQAVERCKKAIKAYNKRMGDDAANRDYKEWHDFIAGGVQADKLIQ